MKTLNEFEAALPQSIPETTRVLIVGCVKLLIIEAFNAGSALENYNTNMELEWKYKSVDGYLRSIN